MSESEFYDSFERSLSYEGDNDQIDENGDAPVFNGHGSQNENFDPFQVFEVDHQQCMLFHVKVTRGRNITKGWIGDMLDTPDPYVTLKMKAAPDSRRVTKTIDNETHPVWEEQFTFLLNSNFKNILEIVLVDANYTVDEVLGSALFNIGELMLDDKTQRTFIFNETSEVDLEFLVEFDTTPDLRYSLCLCDEEKNFREVKRQKAMEAMQGMLGQAQAPTSVYEVPTIGVLGSGGGFRAMVGMSGVFSALWESGILDVVTYTACLSGSSWYISQLYSHPDWPNISPDREAEELKNNIDSSLMWLLKPNSVYRYLDTIWRKRTKGQPISFTDFFGHLVGETILKDRLDSKLTDQQEKIKDGTIPMPLYTCVHVKKDVSAKSFQEWVEFTPYEIGMPKYGTFLKTNYFGSKFFLGRLCRSFPEPPLHYLQGIWGSAFCILFKRLLKDNRTMDPVEMVRQEMEFELDKSSEEKDIESDLSDDEDDEEEKALSSERRGSNAPPADQQLSRKGMWRQLLEGAVTSTNLTLLSTRAGRAGVIHNPLRGLSLNRTYPISPFTPGNMAPISSTDEFSHIFEMHSTEEKKLYMVDAGLTFNSPYPLLLRPQRGVDILLSFDFSARPTDNAAPFKELQLAEKWAKLNHVAFPPIDPSVFEREGMKELYIFRHPTNPYCPVVLHFVLTNTKFREYKRPGVPRETAEEKEFANFDIFDDPTAPYSTFNFKYSHLATDRLRKLTEFNTLLHVEDIKKVIAEGIVKKRTAGHRMPVAPSKVKLLPINRKNKRSLKNFLKRAESVRSARNSIREKRSSDCESETYYSPRTSTSEVFTDECL